MLASILIVFLHTQFPGTLGGFVKCFSCFAVPVFFAITGYFNYNARPEILARRLKHNLRLYLIAIFANLTYGILITVFGGGRAIDYIKYFLPSLEDIAKWFVVHLDPRSGQLWYLSSACLCYAILWVYVRFFGEKAVNYHPLYVIGTCLFSVFLALCVLAPVLGMDVPYPLYRNGYFMGFPLFTLGIFLHEYQDQILTNYQLSTRKQLLLILTGALLSIIQWKGMGMGEMTIGAILEVAALMIFLISHPKVTNRSGIGEILISKFGAWSTWIYLFHIIVLQFYVSYLQVSMFAVFSEAEPYLRPFFVAGLSFLVAVIFERGEWLFRRIHKRK